MSTNFLPLPCFQKKICDLLCIALAYALHLRVEFSIIMLSCFAAVHLLLPEYRPTTTKLFKISYHKPATDLYGKGKDDMYFVTFWIVMFTFLRATAMDYIFTPLARRGGISTKRGLTRFAEQAWLLVYYSVFWTLGMVCSSSISRILSCYYPEGVARKVRYIFLAETN